LPASAGVSLNVDMLVTEGDGIADSRAEYGDSKNWATQVSERRNELTLRPVQRGTGRAAPGAARAARRGDRVLRATACRATAMWSASPTTAAWSRSGATPSAAVQRAAARPAAGLGRGELAHRPPARQPGAPMPNTPLPAPPGDPGCTCT
jgi:hypothetical protein